MLLVTKPKQVESLEKLKNAVVVGINKEVTELYPGASVIQELVPDKSDITLFINGEINRKKVIKNFKKSLSSTNPADTRPINMLVLAQLASVHKSKKPSVLVVIIDEENSKLKKLYIECVKLAFKTFGLKFREEKKFKSIFKGKKSKVRNRVYADTLENDKLSDNGYKKYKKARRALAIELVGSEIIAAMNDGDVSNKSVKKIFDRGVKALKLVKPAKTSGKKGKKKAKKKAKKINKKLTKPYNALRDLDIEGLKLPKIEKIGKMKKKKFMIAIIVHMIAMRSGAELGGKEYMKLTKHGFKALGIEDEFKKAIEAYNAEQKATK